MRRRLEQASAQVEASGQDGERLGALAMLLHAHERLEDALGYYERAAGASPESADWPYLAALVERRLGRAATALDLLESVLELNREDRSAQFHRADALLALGRFAEAEKRFSALCSRWPRFAPGWHGWGRALLAQGSNESATEALEKAVGLSPHEAGPRYSLALAYRRLGRAEQARAALDQHRRLRGSPPDELDDPLLSAVKELRTDLGARVARGALLAEIGSVEEAGAEFRAVLEIEPDNPTARLNLMQLHGGLAQRDPTEFDRAAEQYHALVRTAPSAVAHYAWGLILLGMGRNDPAAEAFDRASALDPYHADALVRSAELSGKAGDLDSTERKLRQALEADPLQLEARMRLGRLLLEGERFSEAARQLEKACRIAAGLDSECPAELTELIARARRAAETP